MSHSYSQYVFIQMKNGRASVNKEFDETTKKDDEDVLENFCPYTLSCACRVWNHWQRHTKRVGGGGGEGCNTPLCRYNGE